MTTLTNKTKIRFKFLARTSFSVIYQEDSIWIFSITLKRKQARKAEEICPRSYNKSWGWDSDLGYLTPNILNHRAILLGSQVHTPNPHVYLQSGPLFWTSSHMIISCQCMICFTELSLSQCAWRWMLNPTLPQTSSKSASALTSPSQQIAPSWASCSNLDSLMASSIIIYPKWERGRERILSHLISVSLGP